MPVEQYGHIGNLRTTALVAVDGGLDFMCWPNFDSPSVFCRLLDKDKGGYFIISPAPHQGNVTTKQQYLPSSNILQTMHLHDDGVMKLIDFFPRPKDCIFNPGKELKQWLIRRVECVRGEICFVVSVLPAFNYAQDVHTVDVSANEQGNDVCTFKSKELSLELQVVIEDDDNGAPVVKFEVATGHELGNSVEAHIRLQAGQKCSFILREPPQSSDSEIITTALVDKMQDRTKEFWSRWVSQSCYKGRWHEIVQRSLLTLKMLTFEPTGAIVAAPTFSLPESFGGTRNWDYRFSYVNFRVETIGD
jgi:GH15 family glucan-1,4-alpha-glucosidase